MCDATRAASAVVRVGSASAVSAGFVSCAASSKDRELWVTRELECEDARADCGVWLVNQFEWDWGL